MLAIIVRKCNSVSTFFNKSYCKAVYKWYDVSKILVMASAKGPFGFTEAPKKLKNLYGAFSFVKYKNEKPVWKTLFRISKLSFFQVGFCP
jgi:hypothetical protein